MNVPNFEPSEEQRAIIEHPLEPLRVAAGAGTGKTTTIVERLAAFVDRGIEPEAALGVTFTNKAAEELGDRLRRRLRHFADDGREVEVTTYHGFAYRILDEMGAVVGMERQSPVIGPGYVRQLLHESIGDGPYDHLDLTYLAGRIDEAAGLGAQLAGNLRGPDDLVAAAPNPADPEGPWPSRIELAGMLRAYADAKRRLGVVDYGDLILLAHRLVTAHPAVAARIRDRYRIVVLDEYQDTDPGQRELLRAIFGGGFPITAVGDADQTIYEWRGASLSNFQSFSEHFPCANGEPAPTLPLTRNRRSGPSILGLANAIRTTLHGAPPFDPLRPAQPVDATVAAGWFRTAEEEAGWVAGEIRRLHDEEGIAWRDIAVLFRKNQQMAVIRDALHNEDVPLEVASLGGLLTVPEVADVHAWLRILDRPEDSVAVARILLGSRYRLGMGDLAPLAAQARQWNRSHTQDQTPEPDEDDILSYPLLEAIDRLPELAYPDAHPQTAGDPDHIEPLIRLDEFRTLYRGLLTEAQGVTLVELVRRIIDRLDGWAEIEAMPAAHGLSARLNLYRFIDLAESWSPLTGRPSLDGFLGYLDLLQDERAPDELDTARISGEDAVSLLTVHRAKGLEWDTVFIPAVSHNAFPSTSQGFDDPVRAARWLPYELRLDAGDWPAADTPDAERVEMLRSRHHAQELRTAYVAVTRARHRLTLTGAIWTGGKRPRQPGLLLDLLKDRSMVPGNGDGNPARDVAIVSWVEEPGEPPVQQPVVTEAPDPHFDGGWRRALRQRLDDPEWSGRQPDAGPTFETYRSQLVLELEGLPAAPEPRDEPKIPTVSVTGLVTLAGCPKQYHWAEVDRLPRRPSPWLRRGTEVHRRIELHQRGVATFAELDDSPVPGQRPPGEGVDPYRSYLGSRFAGMTPSHQETPINLTIEGVRVRGRIDAIFEPEPGSWEIVDYKSGRPGADPAALVQLQTYAVAAAEGAVLGGIPDQIRVTFAYLGTDPVTEHAIDTDAEWLDQARERIVSLATAVKEGDFPPLPSERCRRCDFARFCPAGTEWLASNEPAIPTGPPIGASGPPPATAPVTAPTSR